MKKVLSLVLALVLVLGMIPTFADAHETGAELLFEHEFIYGDENSDLMVEKMLTRDEMTVLFAQMYGKEVEAEAFVAPANFTDAATFGWASNFISFAQASEWIVGYPDGTYLPKNAVTGKELLSALMQVLGYEFEWTTIVADAAAVGLVVSEEGPILRGAAFETIWIAVSAIEINGEGMTIGEKTGKMDPPAPVVTDLAIVSVTADNLKEVVVEFNQEVDKDTVVAANFKLSASLASTATLMEDGKTVVVAVTPTETGQMNNQVEYTLTVDGVMAVAGSELLDTAVKFTAFDATLPTVVGVTYTGPKSFEIEFSEPIKVYPTVSVKSGTSTLSVNAAGMTGKGTNVITVPTFSTFADGTTYNIQITNAEDFAGYKNVIRTVAAEYIKDVTAPVATVVKATQEYVVVEFNKPVSGLNPSLFSHTFSAWTAQRITATDVYGDPEITSGTTFYVWFNGPSTDEIVDRPIAAGTTTFTVLPKTTSPAAEIVDLWGNKFVEATFSITVTADTTAPEVKTIKITKETEFSVEFTKNVTFVKANVEVLDADGKAITGIVLDVDGSGKAYTVDFGKNMAGKTIIVNLTGVKDTTLLTNKMADFSIALEVTDKTAPTIEKATYDHATRSLFIFFNEDVDAETALTASNYYTVDSTTSVYTKLTVTPTFVNGNSTVKFVFAEGKVPANISDQLFVTGVKDVAGNEILPTLIKDVQEHNVAVVPTMAKAHATATNKVVVTFNEELALVDLEAFNVASTTAQAMEVSLVDGVTVVTLTFADNFFTDPGFAPTAYDVTYANAALIKNLFNVSPATGETEDVLDKIKPALIATAPIVVEDGKIVLKFTEALNSDLSGLYAQDLVVTKGTATLVAGVDYTTSVTAGSVNVEVTITGGLVAGAEYRVSSKATVTYIQDVNANKAVSFETPVLAK